MKIKHAYVVEFGDGGSTIMEGSIWWVESGENCRTRIVFTTLFGLSTNFWMAISMRFLLGAFSGIFGPIQAYATEVCRTEHQTLALSFVVSIIDCAGYAFFFQTSSAWAIGMIIGPAIGGFLAQPAEKYPNIFTEGSLFARFPYFLPCLCISIWTTAATVACFWLPETLHKHNATNEESHGTVNTEKTQKSDEIGSTESESLFRNRPLMSCIIVYCIFSLHNMAYGEVTGPKDDCHQVLSVTGIGLFLFQLALFPKLEKILGPLTVARISAGLGNATPTPTAPTFGSSTTASTPSAAGSLSLKKSTDKYRNY